MNEENKMKDRLSKEDRLEIDLMAYIRKLWERRILLIKIAGIATLIGLIISFSIPKTYTAEVILSPESRKGGSNLSGMASMLGIGNANAGGDANALNISMTSDIIASTPFILELFDTHVQTLDGKLDTTLVAYLATQKLPWWRSIMALPNRAIHGISKLFSSNSSTTTEEKPINLFQLTPKQRGQANAIKSVIMAETDKKSGMTKISVTLQDPLVAATLVDTVLTQLQKYITNYKTSKAQEDCRYWEQLFRERQKEYYLAQETYATYADANQGVILQSVRIEQERLQNEMNMAYQIFSQVATQLQMSRAKLQEEKPAFAILEPASVPLYPTGTNSKLIVITLIFLSVTITAFWILFGKNLWTSIRKGLDGNIN